ncbi:MAG TPA: hypothetical protein VLI90_06920, partial [Tepidisphaeraceae bacterium]|nr:hypothetical protein [Tepidisphaeraceae bacterium]
MQVVLWAIFAGTVGLAELVTRERTHTARAELSQARTIDHLTLRLPGKWIVSNGADGSNTLLVAHEPASGLGHGEGRTLTLSRQRARGASSTQEFLLQSGLLHGALSMGEDADPDGEDGGGPVAPAPAEAAAMQPLKMGGWPAVMTTVYRPHISPMGFSASLHKQVIAAALLPSHQAVVLTLESAMALQPTAEFPDDSAGGEDAVMVRQIAEGMRIDGEQSWQKESTLTLSSGLSVTLPDGWLLSPAVDSNRTRRAIALERDNSMRVEINPCVLLPDDGPDVVRSMLLASHPELCGAKLTRDDAGRWHAQWPGASAMGSRASGARAIGRADGNSVLLVFFGAPIESGDFNDA